MEEKPFSLKVCGSAFSMNSIFKTTMQKYTIEKGHF